QCGQPQGANAVTTSIHPAASGRRSLQSGISLMIVLLLLVVMSVLGIVILRSSAMQERMSANLLDRNLAFQATEAALRHAQDVVLGGDPPGSVTGSGWDGWQADAGSCSSNGICP